MMCRFKENAQKPDFVAKNGKNWPFLAKIAKKRDFFSKIRLEHFFLVLPRYNFVPSFRKIWCANLQISRHGLTNGRRLNHKSQPRCGGPKRVQKWPRFFFQNKNFHWPFLNNKLSLNNKKLTKIINGLEENGLKQPKTICHHKQCIFDPKMAKMAKTRIFLDTTLPKNDSKQLSQVSDQVLDKSDVRIRRKCPKMAKEFF